MTIASAPSDFDKLSQFLTSFNKFETRSPFVLGVLLLLVVVLLFLLASTSRSTTTTHGSAHFAKRGEIRSLIPKRWEKKNRLILGSSLTLFPYRIGLTDKQQESHILIVAPSGKGKTASIIIPGLLGEDGHRSIFVNDVKRELISKCLGALQTKGYQCFILSPTRPEESHHYNPLLHVSSMEDAESLADCIVSNTGSSKEPFWNNAARLLLTATILHIRASNPSAPLTSLTDILCGTTMTETMNSILHSPSQLARNIGTAFLTSLPDNPKLAGSIIADMSSRLLNLQNPKVAAVTTSDEFDFEAFLSQPTAFVLSIPASDTERLQWLSAAFSMQLMNYTTKKAEMSPNGRLPRPLAYYFDELANMGVIPHFLQHLSLVRSAGIACIMAIQNFAQLQYLYGQEGLDTITSNAATHIAFSGAGQKENEFYSRRMGEYTIQSQSKSIGGSTQAYRTRTQSDASRPLMKPDELRTMKTNHLIVLSESFPPIIVQSRPYFKHRTLIKQIGLPLMLPARPIDEEEIEKVALSSGDENPEELEAEPKAFLSREDEAETLVVQRKKSDFFLE